MPAVLRVSGELAHQVGLLPLIWLTARWSGGRKSVRAWWLLGIAFAVSWVADWVSHRVGTFPVGPPYLALQAGLIAGVLAPKLVAQRFGMILAATALFAMLYLDPEVPNVLMYTVAWLGLLAIVWPEPLTRRVRWMLAVAFGGGWLAWMGYVLRPDFASWATYQVVRTTGLGLFCWASWAPSPRTV